MRGARAAVPAALLFAAVGSASAVPPTDWVHGASDVPPAADSDLTEMVAAKALGHRLQHRYDLAAREYGIAIARYPDRADFYEDRCLVYLDWDGHDDLALADCDKAVGLKDKPIADFFVHRAQAYAGTGRYEEAIHDYDTALDLDPKTFRGRLYRCQARAMWGRELDRAWNDCAAYLNQSGGDVLSHEALALVELRSTHYAGATSEADKALAIFAKRAPSLYLRGLAKRRSGDEAGGAADIAAAKAIDAGIADEYAKYGVAP